MESIAADEGNGACLMVMVDGNGASYAYLWMSRLDE